VPSPAGAFAEWLRGLPLEPAGTQVRLFDGRLKSRQDAHAAVVDLDVGSRDLQQCADAVIRLRAEYLWSSGRAAEIAFRFTDGFSLDWKRWAAGKRPAVGRPTRWVDGGGPDASRASFRRYLAVLMTYAGSLSLSRELNPRRVAGVHGGDVLVQGGSPGHAILVLDAVENAAGERLVMLGQSYMPAQQFHVLKNPADAAGSPWHRARSLESPGGLVTAEWWKAFTSTDLRGFE
jgi:hypothetical protein